MVAALVLVSAVGGPAIAACAALAMITAMGALLGVVFLPLRFREGWERLTASIALPLVVLILGGLLLVFSGIQLSQQSWLGLVGLVLIATNVIALSESDPSPRWKLPRSRRSSAFFALALGQVALAAGLAVAGARTAPQTPFTQLTLTHPQLADSVIIGLANHELSDETYRVEALVDGEIVTTWLLTPLPRGERWSERLPLPSSWQNVVARVYRLPDASIPYRQTVVWNHEPP